MKTALVHHWLVRMRGGEKVLEAIAEILRGADIFTLVYDPAGISKALRRHKVVTSWLGRLPHASRAYPYLLPLFPSAVRSLDLRSYDLVVSSDASLVKGVRASPQALHVCYCHSPPRYLWDMEETYLRSVGPLRAAARAVFARLRRWDRAAAQRVDRFVANSEHVRRRIRRHYGREATVIYPPVEEFDLPTPVGPGDHYLFVGHLVPYKRADLAVRALSRLGRKLVVIGEGPERKRLERLAGPRVRFRGWLPDDLVREHFASCRALVFPGEEDFGIVPVEAQMAGRPVLAYGAGGVLETVVPGETGMFFERQTEESLISCVRRFESAEQAFSRERARRNALRFGKEVFRKKMEDVLRWLLAARRERARGRTRAVPSRPLTSP